MILDNYQPFPIHEERVKWSLNACSQKKALMVQSHNEHPAVNAGTKADSTIWGGSTSD